MIISIIKLPNLILNRNLSNLKFITLVFVLQNIICILANDIFGKAIGQICILYKEVILYGSVCACFIIDKKLKIKRSIFPFVLEIIVLILFLFVGSVGVFAKLICLRQIMTPIILVLYGACIKLTARELESFIKFIINIGVFQSIFGIFERFFLGDNFWLSVHIEKFMSSKGFEGWLSDIGLPGNFYSFDLYSLMGKSFRRLAGISADPLLTAHFLAFCIVILLFNSLYQSKAKYNIIFVLMATATLLTLSKGGVLIILLACLHKMWKYNKIYASVMFLIIGISLSFIINTNFFDTVSIHVSGLTTSFTTHFFIGNGLGSWGNYAKLYEGTGGAGESYIGVVIGQTGLIGLITFLYPFLKNGKNIFKSNNNNISYAVVIYVISVLIEAFVSESAISYIGSGIPFIIFGIILNLSDKCQNTSIRACLKKS